MSITRVQNGLTKSTIGGIAPGPAPDWVRPSDWLPLPEMPNGNDDPDYFVGLLRLSSGALEHTVALTAYDNVSGIKQSTYQVDWGDGTVDTVERSELVTHVYDYASLPHVLADGSKQAVVKITYSTDKVSEFGVYGVPIQPTNQIPMWLDVNLKTSYVLPVLSGTGTKPQPYLQRAVYKTSADYSQSFFGMFKGSAKLIVTDITTKVPASSFSHMYAGCTALTKPSNLLIPTTYFGASSMFNGCASLKEVKFDTTNCTDTTSMFYGCNNLSTVDLVSTSNTMSISNFFSACYNLETVKGLDLSSIKGSCQSAFRECSRLDLSVLPEDLNLPAVTSVDNLFYQCVIPHVKSFSAELATTATYLFNKAQLGETMQLTLPVCTNVTNMFGNSYGLVTLDNISLPKCTTAGSFLSYVYTLQRVGSITFAPTFVCPSYMFFNLANLVEIDGFNAAGTTNPWMASIPVLRRFNVTNNKGTLSFTGAQLGYAELLEMFNNLPVVTNSPTITITGNPGASQLTAEDRAIATGKGWKITG